MKRIKNILITWDGLWSIPAAGMVLFIISSILLTINPQADVIGLGLLQDAPTAAFRVIIGNTVAQLGIAVNVFLFFGYSVKEFKQHFQSLSPCKKQFIVFGLFVSYLLAFILALP